jgi:hypothetical protein
LLGVSLASSVGNVVQLNFLELIDMDVDQVGNQENGEEEEVIQQQDVAVTPDGEVVNEEQGSQGQGIREVH